MNEYVKKVQLYIEQHNLTHEEFAKLCGVPRPTVDKLLARATYAVSPKNTIKLNKILNLPEDFRPFEDSLELSMLRQRDYKRKDVVVLSEKLTELAQRGLDISIIIKTLDNCVELTDVVCAARKLGASTSDIRRVLIDNFHLNK